MGIATSKDAVNSLDSRYIKISDQSKIVSSAQTQFDNRYAKVADMPAKSLWCADGSTCSTPASAQQINLTNKTKVSGDLTATGNVQGATFTATGDVSAVGFRGTSFIGTGDVNAANVTSTGLMKGNDVVATNSISTTGNVQGGTFTATGDISAVGFRGTSFTGTGDVNASNLTASASIKGMDLTATNSITTTGSIQGGTFTATGDVSAVGFRGTSFTGTGDVNSANVTASATIKGKDVVATNSIGTTGNIVGNYITANSDVNANAFKGATFTATGDITGMNVTATSTLKGKDIVATNSLTAPNVYSKTDTDNAINTKTQNLVNAGTLTNLTTSDVTAKSLTSTTNVAVPRGSTLRMSGMTDPVHSIGHAKAYGINDQDGPFIAGWQSTPAGQFSGSFGTVSNVNGAPATPKFAMRWDAGARAYFPSGATFNSDAVFNNGVKIGSWNLADMGGTLVFWKDGVDPAVDKADVGMFKFDPLGNFRLMRYSPNWLADDYIRKNVPYQFAVANHSVAKQNNNYLRANDTDGVNQGWKTDADRNWGQWSIRDPSWRG